METKRSQAQLGIWCTQGAALLVVMQRKQHEELRTMKNSQEEKNKA
jgi:hypothetical protein